MYMLFFLFLAMKNLVQAWNRVTAQTIVRCFAKCGFTEQPSNDIEDDPFSDLVAAVDELRDKDPSQVPDDITPEAIVSVDDAAMVTRMRASKKSYGERIGLYI